jgi:hypothetical protein
MGRYAEEAHQSIDRSMNKEVSAIRSMMAKVVHSPIVTIISLYAVSVSDCSQDTK